MSYSSSTLFTQQRRTKDDEQQGMSERVHELPDAVYAMLGDSAAAAAGAQPHTGTVVLLLNTPIAFSLPAFAHLWNSGLLPLPFLPLLLGAMCL